MSEIENKISELKSKNRKSIIIYVLVSFIVLLAFLFLQIYSQKIKVEKQITEQQILLLENEKRFQDYILEANKNRENTFKNYTNEEVNWMLQELGLIKSLTSNEKAINSIDSIQKTLSTLSKIVSDTTIIIYHKRLADKNNVLRAINSIAAPKYELNIKPAENDQGRSTINTMYYGSFVKVENLELLKNRLDSFHISILNIKPFEETSDSKLQNSSIELKFEDTRRSNGDNENRNYQVKMYSFNPIISMRDSIANFINRAQYQLTRYPDLDDKPSSFASTPTIFYYDKSARSKAIELTEELNKRFKTFGIGFKYQEGALINESNFNKKHTLVLQYSDPLAKEVFDVSNTKYLVKLESHKIPYSTRQDIYLFLRKYGFLNIEAHNYKENKPSYMKSYSCIIYYSEKSKEKAIELARIMKLKTGKEYKVEKDNISEGDLGKEESLFSIQNLRD